MAIDRSIILKNRLNWLKNREKDLVKQPMSNALDKNLTEIRSSTSRRAVRPYVNGLLNGIA